MSVAALELSAGDALALSARMLDGLSRYELSPNERRLAVWVLARTFSARRTGVVIDFDLVAREMGGRADRWGMVLGDLQRLGVVFRDASAGFIEPNAEWSGWSRARALRVDRPTEPNQLGLGVRSDRPLDAALASIGRDQAIARVREAEAQAEARPGSVAESVTGERFDWREHLRLFKIDPALAESYKARFPDPGGGGPPLAASMAGGGGGAKALSLASSCTKSLAELKDGGDWRQVWEKLAAVDSTGALNDPNFRKQWDATCREHPKFVRGLIRYFEEARQKRTIGNPMAWMARIARAEGKLK